MNVYRRLLRDIKRREIACRRLTDSTQSSFTRGYYDGRADAYANMAGKLERLLSFNSPPDPEDEEETKLEPEEVTVDAEGGKD